MNEKSSHLLILYVGTTKIAAVKARAADRSLIVDSWMKREPSGFSKGLVTDTETAAGEVRDMLAELGGEGAFQEMPLHVLLSNAEIRSYRVSSSIYFSNPKTITDQDVHNVISQTRSVATIPLDELILWSEPQEFLVNDLPGVKQPAGLEGKRLGVTLHLFTLPAAACRGFTNVFDRLEIEPDQMVPKGMSSSRGLLKEQEAREGAILIEIGGGFTELLYYYHGSLHAAKTVYWGSEDITEALSAKWGLTPKDARRLKHEFGSLEADGSHALPILLTEPDGKVRFKSDAAPFRQLVMETVSRGLDSLGREIQAIRKEFPHVYQLVFSGGMTQMPGFLETVQSRLGIPSRLGYVNGITAPQELSADPSMHALLGQIKSAAAGISLDPVRPGGKNLFDKTVGQVRNWFMEYF